MRTTSAVSENDCERHEQMNWDTNETWNWILDTPRYRRQLSDCIGNELEFIYIICRIVVEVNRKLSSKWINPAKVNGNELYVDFCDYYGNEQEGWK